eukprot:TRINITY_DN47500_c0_g1_i1.p1 TRINITY_DN47500_c0_g1~~TRINITY_DN47500_c0_g1_i1.p1  ORF type:complete len:184 (+),score=46.33 TRINITY_DN47500_c0_g1_i1:514-1065(+)
MLLQTASVYIKDMDHQTKMQSSSALFFKLASAGSAGKRVITVSLIQGFRECDSDSGQMSDVKAANLQQQLYCMWYDKLMKAKTAPKFKGLVDLCPAARYDLIHLGMSMSDVRDPEVAFVSGEAVTSLLRFEIQVLRNLAVDWEKASEIELLEAKMAVDNKSFANTAPNSASSDQKLVVVDGGC